ncbi:type III-A CRISPR-associated RAMP protein Csm3 [Metallosphaera hakonensis JCM 8857 = DSM 7519]|uniref:CRISPR system Cms endoribonuclease Csm3 n=2 Tax=Metallosphaera hakonensis TaxID=79601 RepID=A0A2U9IX08_9CREN|nr:type III-A CRISPR-associated RAMP protein Csm3 [Metallosphaera hakonensis]AWS00436.1 type III-A CRISPR-associated RAMP protein Csm3 [Metallosphaera hakonensis JCM 8857 = DSM 7519]
MSVNHSISLRLEKIVRLKLSMVTVTGLLISAGRILGRIGGADVESMSMERIYQCNQVEIHVRVPYIPGSSLKGRIRSLLEVALGLPLYSSDGKIWSHTLSRDVRVSLSRDDKLSVTDFVKTLINTDLDRMFGYGAFPLNEVYKQMSEKESVSLMNSLLSVLSPTSLLVEDMFPDREQICQIYNENELVTFEDFMEDKNENRIDRVTSAADPRSVTRVKPGVKFTGTLSLLVYDKNLPKVKDYLDLLVKGMILLEKTYLGASGSRGYGRVKFTNVAVSIYDPVTMAEITFKEYDSVENLSKDIGDLVKAIASQQTGVKT